MDLTPPVINFNTRIGMIDRDLRRLGTVLGFKNVALSYRSMGNA
jgi:hypothetical protein